MQKGFTLVELLVVIAIVSILTTLVVMKLNSAKEVGEQKDRIEYYN